MLRDSNRRARACPILSYAGRALSRNAKRESGLALRGRSVGFGAYGPLYTPSFSLALLSPK